MFTKLIKEVELNSFVDAQGWGNKKVRYVKMGETLQTGSGKKSQKTNQPV